MDVETQKKLVTRYQGLLAKKIQDKAPAERVRIFRNKLKMHQRRLAKIQPKKKAGAEGEKPAETAAPAKVEEKK